jgi:hypothetical protein
MTLGRGVVHRGVNRDSDRLVQQLLGEIRVVRGCIKHFSCP